MAVASRQHLPPQGVKAAARRPRRSPGDTCLHKASRLQQGGPHARALGTAFPSLAGLLWGRRRAPFLPDASALFLPDASAHFLPNTSAPFLPDANAPFPPDASAPFPPNTSAPFLPDASAFPTRCKCLSYQMQVLLFHQIQVLLSYQMQAPFLPDASAFPIRCKCSFPTRYKYHKRIGVIEVMIDIVKDHEITPREADHPTVSSVGIVTKFSKPKIRTHGLPRTQEQRDKPHEEIIHEASRTSCRRFPSCSSGREIFRGHSQVKTRPLPRIWAKKPSVPPAETEADAVLDWRRRSVSQYSSGTSLHLLPKGGHPSRSFAVPHVSTTWSLLHFHEESLLSSFT
ncbi:uncharacterized protein [Canis lupus baileyi]|uniref:uncharacterized protein n=1 Tax=Canis lupus baileyi TaxID=143281 RepID=UPI003B975A4D